MISAFVMALMIQTQLNNQIKTLNNIVDNQASLPAFTPSKSPTGTSKHMIDFSDFEYEFNNYTTDGNCISFVTVDNLNRTVCGNYLLITRN